MCCPLVDTELQTVIVRGQRAVAQFGRPFCNMGYFAVKIENAFISSVRNVVARLSAVVVGVALSGFVSRVARILLTWALTFAVMNSEVTRLEPKAAASKTYCERSMMAGYSLGGCRWSKAQVTFWYDFGRDFRRRGIRTSLI